MFTYDGRDESEDERLGVRGVMAYCQQKTRLTPWQSGSMSVASIKVKHHTSLPFKILFICYSSNIKVNELQQFFKQLHTGRSSTLPSIIRSNINTFVVRLSPNITLQLHSAALCVMQCSCIHQIAPLSHCLKNKTIAFQCENTILKW